MRTTARKFRERASEAMHGLRDLARRLAVSLSGDMWQLEGYTDPVTGKAEVFEGVEVFQGIGIRSRPRRGAGEVVVLNLGGGAHPVVVATRDREIEVALDEDETAIFNSNAVVKILKTGEVLVRAKSGAEVIVDDGGGAAALATKGDLDGIRTWLLTHTHTGVTTGAGTSAGPAAPPPAVAGTLVLRAK